jgi:hypothetical protein
MLRFAISEHSQGALPLLDLDEDVVVIGSGVAARIRLPAEVARPAHIRFEGHAWTLLADAKVGGMMRAAGDSGPVGHGIVVELANYRVRISATPTGVPPTSSQRTESLARELVRSLLGEGAAPTLEIERGPSPGSRRPLPPPESTVVIGRGDEATWVILDEDLSRAHAEVRRGWDGVTVTDLGSKNGTFVGKVKVGSAPVELHDGEALALGDVVLRFRDPAEQHLRGASGGSEAQTAQTAGAAAGAGAEAGAEAARSGRAQSVVSLVVFAAIAALALAALIWILAS